MSDGGAKNSLDWLALGTAAATLLDYLPAIAAALSIIWTLVRFYEWARVRIFGIKD